MKQTIAFALPIVFAIATSTNAQTLPDDRPTLDREEIAAACEGDRLEDLPNPYSDLPPNHWAYDAVLRLTYCVSSTVEDRNFGELNPPTEAEISTFSD